MPFLPKFCSPLTAWLNDLFRIIIDLCPSCCLTTYVLRHWTVRTCFRLPVPLPTAGIFELFSGGMLTVCPVSSRGPPSAVQLSYPACPAAAPLALLHLALESDTGPAQICNNSKQTIGARSEIWNLWFVYLLSGEHDKTCSVSFHTSQLSRETIDTGRAQSALARLSTVTTSGDEG